MGDDLYFLYCRLFLDLKARVETCVYVHVAVVDIFSCLVLGWMCRRDICEMKGGGCMFV